ncbi:WD40 repeat protein [Actinoplanes tereljensis]|uniref:NACHT domain-containing protein n=1 Tax=Paractinoplanes tereljensis TaxID=571912 RepID=A0A919NF07_9ACTN|nr:NACHT domain-containing protein [Actinoplanes tereljensis]GIF17350.1 hypothetical protein Ate02nite_00800 [Actinoplanes tereljensis]
MNPSALKRSVIRVTNVDGETLGSGFAALTGGYFLTCWHVIEDVADLRIQIEGDNRRLPAAVRADLSDPAADIAVLHAPDAATVPVVRASRSWAANDGAWTYGFQYQAHVSSGYPVIGRISGDTVVDGQEFILIADVDVQRGISGAPLLDMDTGRVVGIVQARLSNKGVGLAVPISAAANRWVAFRQSLSRPEHQLRGRVADLFGAMGYRVTEQSGEAGITPSLVAELTVGPVLLRALVVVLDGEAQQPGDAQRAVHLVGSLLAQRRYDKGFVVTAAAHPAPVHAVADTHHVLLITVADLERTLIDFDHYLRAVVHDYENFGEFYHGDAHPVIDHFRWCDLYRYYIDLRCVDLLSGQSYPSSASTLTEFLGTPERHLLSILGDYGTGKTSLCLQLTYDLARECLRDPAATRIPLFIPLRNFDRQQGMRRLILDTLTDYGIQVTDYKAFELMSRAGRFVLLFDGFDEVADGLDRREVTQLFSQITTLVTGRAKIVLTCRTHYFRSEHQSLETLTTEAMTPLMREVRAHRGFGIVELQKLDEPQILELMSRRYAQDYRGRWGYISNVYNLADLARTPIMLTIMLNSFGDLLSLGSDTAVKSATLYDMYTKFWLERDDERSDITAQERLAFAQALAWRMYATDRLFIPYEELSAAVGEFFAESFPHDPQRLQKLDTNVRTCSFLARDRFGNFMFAHKSFMEFFVAKRLAGSVAEWPVIDLGQRVIPYEITDFVQQLASPHDIATIKAQALNRQNSDILRGMCMDILIGLGDTVREEPLVFAMVAAPDGRLVTANADGTATVLTPDLTIAATLTGHDDWIRQVVISPDGHLLATCGWDGRVLLWDLPGPTRRGEFRLPERVNSVCFDRHSRLLLCAGYDRAISVLHVDTMRPAFTLTGHAGAVNAVIASPTADVVVSAGLDKTLRVWSLEQAGRPTTVRQQEEPITRLAFAADGRSFAAGNWTGKVTVWEVPAVRPRWMSSEHTNMIGALAYSPDSELLASSSDDRTAKIWNAASGNLIATLPHIDFVTAVCFGPQSRHFYCGGYDSQVHRYDTNSWELRTTTVLGPFPTGR